jgi:HAMP domain-containing protein
MAILLNVDHEGVRRYRFHNEPSFVQRALLRIPLELKLLGANMVIMLVAVLMLFGPLKFEPARITDALIVVAGLAAGATVNFVLVRLALRPVNNLTRVAWLVSEGVIGARVPACAVTDSELAHLSTTVNDLLDGLVAEREAESVSRGRFSMSDGRDRRYIESFDPLQRFTTYR